MFVSCFTFHLRYTNKLITRKLNLSNKFTLNTLSKLKMDVRNIEELLKKLVPPLSQDKHKGQAGRIGVFGGSLEYTGAPFFAAYSALRVGADLSHVFCAKDAATVIKSYSPELIVHPLLDVDGAVDKIEPWLDRLHVILIGPGLGRDTNIFCIISDVIRLCKIRNKPLIIDADGLFYISQNPNVLKDYPAAVVLTPNIMEFSRLVKRDKIDNSTDKRVISEEFLKLSNNITILCKGQQDEIFNGGFHVEVREGGSGRRCGGQGDLLSGSLSTFLAWALSQLPSTTDGNNRFDYRPVVAGYCASTLTRRCNRRAFEKHQRSMITSDMLEEIHGAFNDLFGSNN